MKLRKKRSNYLRGMVDGRKAAETDFGLAVDTAAAHNHSGIYWMGFQAGVANFFGSTMD